LATDSQKVSILQQSVRKVLAWKYIEESDEIKSFEEPQKKEHLRTEAVLTEGQLQDLSDTIIQLKNTAPGLDFKYSISIECNCSDKQLLEKINEILKSLNGGLKL
jgi:predicted HAD superfamily hydrolase